MSTRNEDIRKHSGDWAAARRHMWRRYPEHEREWRDEEGDERRGLRDQRDPVTGYEDEEE